MNETAGDSIRQLSVVGAGTMGSGIALAALLSGWPVGLYDISAEVLTKARAYLEEYLERNEARGALTRLKLTQEMADLVGADLWIEAVLEDLDLKRSVFEKIEALAAPSALLATNTSTLSVTALAASLKDPSRLVGMHFFNPAAVLPLVEVVRGAASAEANVKGVVAAAEALGKTPVVVQDTPGFLVNRLARPFYGEGLRLLGEGAAEVSVIDAVVESAGFPMGPFRLMDLIGQDVNLAATKSTYKQTHHEPRYRPHRIQERKVAAGELGRKSGSGFYAYDSQGEIQDRTALVRGTPAGAGSLWLVGGKWERGLAEWLARVGFTVSGEAPRALAAFVLSGRGQGLREALERVEAELPAERPVFCQLNDVSWSELALWVKNPARVIGIDALFLAEAWAACLVGAAKLPKEQRRAAEGIMRAAGRSPVWVQDRPALVLSRLVCSLVNEAAFAVEEGLAEAETIDRAMRLGVSFPRGPLEWGRELGWHRVVAVLDHLNAEYQEPRYRVCSALRRWARAEMRG